MGFLRKREDPKVIAGLLEALERQRDDHKQQMEKLIQQVGDQNQLLRELLDQYINHGVNTNESLNERAQRKAQYLAEPEWGPVTDDPFDGI